MFSKGGAVAVFDREGEYDQLIAFIKEKDLDGKFVYQSPMQWQGRLKRMDNEKTKLTYGWTNDARLCMDDMGLTVHLNLQNGFFSVYK